MDARTLEEKGYELLGQIPLVQSIREGGDEGKPVALNTESITGMAFDALADNIIKAVDRRNRDLPPTDIVEMKTR